MPGHGDHWEALYSPEEYVQEKLARDIKDGTLVGSADCVDIEDRTLTIRAERPARSTADADWSMARAWLARRLSSVADPNAGPNASSAHEPTTEG